MEIVKAKHDIVKTNLEKATELKRQLLQSPEVVSRLTEREANIAARAIANRDGSATGPIRNNPDEYREKVVMVLRGVARDVGIKRLDDQEIKRLIEVILSHYSDLTLAEIKYAFDLSITGDLDKYLPRNKSNEPDKNHYQTFSAEYLCRILNAFRRLRNEVWAKAHRSLPDVTEITDEEKEEARAGIKSYITEKFKAYKEDQSVKPVLRGATYILRIFEKAGLVSGVPEPTEENLTLALTQMMKSPVYSKYQKAHFTRENAEPLAKIRAANDAIVAVFDEMIKKGFSPEELI